MNNKAFTLAEVLITLGVIGIVAALTLPVLIQNHKKVVVATRLEIAYNTFNNAIRLSEIDNGEMKTWPTGKNLNINIFWNNYLKPYFNNSHLCITCTSCGYSKDCNNLSFRVKLLGGAQYVLMSDDSRILFQLNDGTIIFYPRNYQSKNGEVYVSDIFIDINGPLKPNESGRDVFYFKRNNNSGNIIPMNGKCKDDSPLFCAYEIMANGWKIPNDYPFKF